ncbi:hypothetical protein CSB69_1455 [Morganella morganii]|nr:hypothetical protein CSB69_1455 [Morganella morganii]
MKYQVIYRRPQYNYTGRAYSPRKNTAIPVSFFSVNLI